MDLQIERLALTINNGSGHEHRVEPIAARAVALLGERLDHLLAAGHSLAESSSIPGLSTTPVDMDLGAISDEAAAEQLADVLLAALAPRLDLTR